MRRSRRYDDLDTTPDGPTAPRTPLRGSVPWKPEPYQRKAVKWLLERGAAGLFLDPGLGKTSITLAATSVLRGQQVIKGILIIAPRRPMYLVWPKERDKWTDFNHLDLVILHGKGKEERLRSKSDVYMINPEGLRWLFRTLGSDPSRWPFDTLAIDESTKFKNTRTQRFKELKGHLTSFRRRYILTGSPAPNGLEDLFGQMYVLDQGRSLGRYITHYRNEFFNSGGYGGYTHYLKEGADELIYDRIAPLVLRMDEKDYLQLPPLIIAEPRVVELPPEARAAYDHLEEHFKLDLADGTVRAANAAAASGKLRQLANGGIYNDAVPGLNRLTTVIHHEKDEALVDLLEELEGQPTLVAYEFNHDLARVKLALKAAGFGDVPHVGGGVSDKTADQIERDWNDGKLPVLLGQPQSISHGLNLQGKGRALIWYALTWNLEDHDQFIKRIHRKGQKKRVFVHYIVAKDTIDEVMMTALKRKTRTQRALLDALRERYLPPGRPGRR